MEVLLRLLRIATPPWRRLRLEDGARGRARNTPKERLSEDSGVPDHA